jgi:PAS domain S-box-containing protein
LLWIFANGFGRKMLTGERLRRSIQSARLLIVDDDEFSRDMLARRLERAGYLVEVRSDALNLEEDIADGGFDLVLLDWLMPRRTGREAMVGLRTRYSADQMPVIVATALVEDLVVADILSVGANDYVAKPISIPILLARIKGQIDRLAAARVLAANLDFAKQATILSRRSRRISETKYSRLMETAQDGIFVLSGDGTVLEANIRALEISGRTREALTGSPFSEALAPFPVDQLLEDLAKTSIVRLRSDQNQGSSVLDVSMSKVEIDGEKFILAIVRDASEQVRLETSMRRIQKLDALGQLTAGVAHDFNNLLTVITTCAESLKTGVQDPKLQRMVTAIDQAADRGAQMTKRLLAFARNQPMTLVASNISHVAARSAEMLGRTLPENIAIKEDIATETWPTLIDESQLEDALLNLALNARDAMAMGGSLTIEAKNERLDGGHNEAFGDFAYGDYVRLSVTDTGAGMTPEVCARVFEPFFTTKEMGKGSGLGLSMVYGFVKQSGGHVRIESTLGRGTRIDIMLPRTLMNIKPECVAAAEPELGDTIILLVEDDEHVRCATAMMLETFGFAHIEVDNPKAALAILQTTARVDLLLTDQVMPGVMSGSALVQEAHRLRPGLPAIIASGFHTEAPNRDCHHASYVVLTKPFRGRDLSEAINSAFSMLAPTPHAAAVTPHTVPE